MIFVHAILSRTAVVVAVLSVALGIQVKLFAAAAGGPTVSIDGPVTVQGTVGVAGPVEVQGSVEVLNDVLRIPYNHRLQGTIGTSLLQFPEIPAGKRLVIKTISVIAAMPPGQLAFATLSCGAIDINSTRDIICFVPMPLVGTFPVVTPTGNAVCLGTVTTDIIVDPRLNRRPAVLLSVSGTPAGQSSASIMGYLEDAPAQLN